MSSFKEKCPPDVEFSKQNREIAAFNLRLDQCIKRDLSPLQTKSFFKYVKDNPTPPHEQN